MQTPHTAPSVRHPGYVLAYGVHQDGDTTLDMDRPFLRRVRVPRGTLLNKKPSEVHIGNGWLYDGKQALKIAKEESWGVTEEMRGTMTTELGRAPTEREERRRAVALEMLNFRRWIDDSWNYAFVNVQISTFPDGVAPTADDLASYAVLGGIEHGTTGYGEATEDEHVQVLGDELIEAHLARMAAAKQAEEVRREAVARTRAAMKPVTVQQLGLYLDIPDDAAVRDDGWVQAWVGTYAPDEAAEALGRITEPVDALVSAINLLRPLVNRPGMAYVALGEVRTAAQGAHRLAVKLKEAAAEHDAPQQEQDALALLELRCDNLIKAVTASPRGEL